MPPSVQRSNAKHYKSNTVTEVKEYEGRAHLLPAQEGWEEVADYALEWALANATQPQRLPQIPRDAAEVVKDVRLTHIGGPDAPDRGGWLAAAHRSDIRPLRPTLFLGLGSEALQGGQEDIERELARAPQDIRQRFRLAAYRHRGCRDRRLRPANKSPAPRTS